MRHQSWTGHRAAQMAARPDAEREMVAAFGAQVKRARERRGWTQADLAERAGMSQGAISRVEAALVATSVARAALIAAALGESLDALVPVMKPPGRVRS